jgi:predicted RNase H-like HicB family nuclease
MAHKIHVTAVIWKEGTRYVSRCPEVGVSSYGKTPTAARAALKEAVQLWVSNARKLGILEDLRPSLNLL